MDYTHFVGIDTSKNTLDFAVLARKDILFQLRVGNDLKGIKELMKRLMMMPEFNIKTTLFCMEHTGIYNHHLLKFLFSKKANVCLEAAVKIKSSSGLQRGKNDKIDALRIARYACRYCDEIKLWQPKREALKLLQYFTALRSRLLQAKKQFTVAVKETAVFDKPAAARMKSLCRSSVEAIEKDLAKVEKAIDEIITSDEQLKRLFALITSVNGIGKVTAAEIILTTNEFKDISDPKKFASYAGVAPFSHTSGTSIRGRSRVSPKANKNVKTLLHMAALAAVSYNDDLKQYYQRKLKENKNKMSVLNGVRNKLIHRVFACVRENRLYEKIYEPALI
jgi:transposase